jgi:hypothetical protein
MHKTTLIAFALLAALAIRAENAVLLESFEGNIDCAALAINSGGRPLLSPPGVSLSQYAKRSPYDRNVTEGARSLRIVLSGREKFSGDFEIKLSDDASEKVRKAAASRDVARYILRYDVIFPSMENFAYFNSALHFGDCRDVLISAGGKRTMSVALDLLTGLPPNGPLMLSFADDFVFKQAFTNVTIYLDNIRLVDTYAPGAKPVVHVVQSFEDPSSPTGGATRFTEWDNDKPITRTTFAQYSAAGPSDIRVTDGEHALQVKNSQPGFWHADFTIPFNNTKLAEVLKLDLPPDQRPTPAQLARYTLRWDVTYPDMTNDWMNCTYHTMETFLPVIQVRQDKPANQRLTYSVTLDQVEWGTWMDTYPVLTFITEGPHKAQDIKIYYDNFRLIDTSSVPAPEARKVAAAGEKLGESAKPSFSR